MTLTVRIAERIGAIQMPESPSFADPEQVGVRVACPAVSYQGGKARLDLRVSYRVSVRVNEAYHDLVKSIVVLLEDAERGLAGAVPLIDPFVKPAGEAPLSNWKGLDPDGDDRSKESGWANTRLDVAVPAPRPGAGPTLYLRATLRDQVSNVVPIDLTAAAATPS